MTHQQDELIALLDDVKTLEREHGLDASFNFFDAVDMGRSEIKHTRFLAHMLRPSGPHGLGDAFLRAFLDDVMKFARDAPISRLELLLADISQAEVYAERDHFDITIWLPAQELLVVVENKIGAKQSDGQLKKYREKVKQLYPEQHFLGVFLTVNGYEGADDSWICISYEHVYAQLQTLQADPTFTAMPDVRMALKHYCQLLRNEVIVDPNLVAACKALYIRHRAAIEAVITHGRTSPIQEGARRFLLNHPELMPTASRGSSNRVDLLVKDLEELPGFALAAPGWGGASPVHLWYEWQQEKRLRMYLEIGPLLPKYAETGLRADVVKRVRSAFRSDVNAAISPTYTRIWRKDEKLEEADVDSVVDAMEVLWKAFVVAGGVPAIVDAVTPCLSLTS